MDFISSSDNYPDSNSSCDLFDRSGDGMQQAAGGVKKKEVVIEDDDYDTESYENFGDVEDVESLTDDNKRIK